MVANTELFPSTYRWVKRGESLDRLGPNSFNSVEAAASWAEENRNVFCPEHTCYLICFHFDVFGRKHTSLYKENGIPLTLHTLYESKV